MLQQLDRLATYDNAGIGCEFNPDVTTQITDRRQHEARRMQLLMDEWKVSFSDSHRIPKAALKNTCRFEKRCISAESLISWSVFIILSSLAGIACALLIRLINLS